LRTTLAILTACAIGVCGAPTNGLASDAGAAEFRWHARQAYEAANQPCDFAPGVRRDQALANERQRLAKFEARMSGTPAKLQMDIARADVTYEAKLPPRPDCSPEMLALLSPAETRIGFSKSEIASAISRMESQAPALADIELSTNENFASAGAKLRYVARQLFELANPRCSLSTRAANDAILGPMRTEITRYRGSLPAADSIQVDIAEADVEFIHSITEVECASPDARVAPSTLSAQMLANAKALILSLSPVSR
jgi:hypothetical protein